MLQENGRQYPKYGSDKTLKADGESVRYNPKAKNFIWSNEGERLFKNGDTIIVQPALTFIKSRWKIFRYHSFASRVSFYKNGKRTKKKCPV